MVSCWLTPASSVATERVWALPADASRAFVVSAESACAVVATTAEAADLSEPAVPMLALSVSVSVSVLSSDPAVDEFLSPSNV